MSILNNKKNQEKLNETGATLKDCLTSAVLISLGVTLILGSFKVGSLGKSHERWINAEARICAVYPQTGGNYCKITHALSKYGTKESANHIIEHLNKNEYVSNIEYHEPETLYTVPAGYTICNIVEMSFIKEDGTSEKQYYEPLKTLVDGEYKYSAPNGGTIKQMGKKEYKDENGEIHTEYLEPTEELIPASITYNWSSIDSDVEYRIKYEYNTEENNWDYVSSVPIQTKELTKTK